MQKTLEEALPYTNIDWPYTDESKKSWGIIRYMDTKPGTVWWLGGTSVDQRAKDSGAYHIFDDLMRKNISDITPFAGLTNLGVLFLYYNNITDLTPLAGDKCYDWLWDNNISDISPLAGLKNLTNLDLRILQNNYGISTSAT